MNKYPDPEQISVDYTNICSVQESNPRPVEQQSITHPCAKRVDNHTFTDIIMYILYRVRRIFCNRIKVIVIYIIVNYVVYRILNGGPLFTPHLYIHILNSQVQLHLFVRF